MKRMLAVMAALCLFAGAAWAQTSSATVQVTVTAAPVPATLTVNQSATTVPAGGTVNFGVAVSGPTGAATPTGSVELLATVPGSNTKILVNTFTLTNGSFTCSYPVPTAAPLGVYSLEFAFGGDANYTKSPDFQ